MRRARGAVDKQTPDETAKRCAAQKVAEDPDAPLFLKRAKEPIEDCLAAIQRRIAHITKQRS
jgi:hypothetical protein